MIAVLFYGLYHDVFRKSIRSFQVCNVFLIIPSFKDSFAIKSQNTTCF